MAAEIFLICTSPVLPGRIFLSHNREKFKTFPKNGLKFKGSDEIKLSKSGTSILIEMVNDDDYLDVKKQVISSLGNSLEKAAVNILHTLLNDRHPNIREPAVEALANIASPDSIEPLKKAALSTEERISTRRKAINALSKIRKENPIKIYMELLDYDDEIIKSTVLKAIGKIKSFQNLDPAWQKD